MNDASNLIPLFGWKIPIALFVAIVGLVGTLLGAIIAACIALIVNSVSHKQQNHRLQLQLKHDAQEKEKDRQFHAKREIYLEAANEVAKAGKYLSSFHEFHLPQAEHTAMIAEYGKAITKVHLVGGINTIRSITEADECFQKHTLHLNTLRVPFTQKFSRSQALHSQITEDLQSQSNLSTRYEQVQRSNPSDAELATIAERFKFLQKRIEQAQQERTNLIQEIDRGVLLVWTESRKATRDYAKKLRQTNIVAREELGLAFGSASQDYLALLESADARIDAEVDKVLASRQAK